MTRRSWQSSCSSPFAAALGARRTRQAGIDQRTDRTYELPESRFVSCIRVGLERRGGRSKRDVRASMSLVCFVRATRASTTARRTPGDVFICRENSELVCVGMARCRHSVERTTSHWDGGATPSSVLSSAVLELAGRLARSRRFRAPGGRVRKGNEMVRRRHGATLGSPDSWARDERARAERATWEHEVDRE